MNAFTILLVYLLSLNLIGFVIMGIDKWRARKQAFRVPEATLFLIALIGGSIGSILGMYAFRHKTRHLSFVIGMPLILILQLAVLFFLLRLPLKFIFL